MKMRQIIFSGLVTSIVGMVIGVAATKIGQPDFKTALYPSESYTSMYKNYIWFGAALGLAVGIAQESVRQLKQERDEENRQLGYSYPQTLFENGSRTLSNNQSFLKEVKPSAITSKPE